MKRSPGSNGPQVNAKTYALKLLSYRSRSKKEMLERLGRKGFDSSQIDSVIKFLEDTGLINDRLLASDLVKYSTERRPLGKKGIAMLLAKRGIDRELADKTLSVHTAEMEDAAALEFVERKMKTLKNYPENVIKRRLWGMLQRRGFSIEVIIRVVNSVR
ncbi:MAG: regulatory protein RecX [Nitrospirae bacterium]|nr:regulatory protein RecX [Nitrospirota bacterium]